MFSNQHFRSRGICLETTTEFRQLTKPPVRPGGKVVVERSLSDEVSDLGSQIVTPYILPYRTVRNNPSTNCLIAEPGSSSSNLLRISDDLE